jgi:hypothetical protein
MGGHSHTLPASSGNFGVMGASGDSLDSRGKRRRGNLPKPVTDVLRAWFHEHLDHPYPTEEDKQIFMSRTGLSISQVCLLPTSPTNEATILILSIDQQLVHQRPTTTITRSPKPASK